MELGAVTELWVVTMLETADREEIESTESKQVTEQVVGKMRGKATVLAQFAVDLRNLARSVNPELADDPDMSDIDKLAYAELAPLPEGGSGGEVVAEETQQ
jgi:hypothetical protein